MAELRVTEAVARAQGAAGAAEPEQTRAGRYQARGLPLGNPRVLASVAALAATTTTAGAVLPATVWSAALHLGIVFLGLWLARPRDVYILAGLASVLVLAGPFATLLGPGPSALARDLAPGAELANRAMVLLAIWALAAVIAGSHRRETALRARLAKEVLRREAGARDLARLRDRRRPEPLSVRLGDEKDPGHEIRTLLNAIVGFSEAARQEIFGPHADPRYRDYMSHISESGWSLLQVFERGSLGTPERDRQPEPGARRPRGGAGGGDTADPDGTDASPDRPPARAVNE